MLACKPSTTSAALEEAKKTNIDFRLTDDKIFATVTAGNEEIYTPNLDPMKKEGTTFTQGYNMDGWHDAICVASRSMIISSAYMNLTRVI